MELLQCIFGGKRIPIAALIFSQEDSSNIHTVLTLFTFFFKQKKILQQTLASTWH
jgi:hypothetical protein